MRTRDEELKNHDKITRNLYAEYEQLQKRVEKGSDPLYLSELKRRNHELESRLKLLEREQKLLEIEQYRREKRLDKIIKQGEPEGLKQVQMASKNLNLVSDKYKAVSLQYSKAIDLKDAQSLRHQDLDSRVRAIE